MCLSGNREGPRFGIARNGPMKSYFPRLRDRHHLRKLNKEKKELIGLTPRCGDTKARVRWLNAQLALAVKNNDHAEVERLTPICVAARKEYTALLAIENAGSNPGVEIAKAVAQSSEAEQ
jgi:hypothetical protein